MIPFLTYSVKVVYIITFIAFKIYVRIELYTVYMVQPSQLSIEGSHGAIQKLGGPINILPIASYSYNCIYCARCNLGMSCKSHIAPAQINKEDRQSWLWLLLISYMCYSMYLKKKKMMKVSRFRKVWNV